LSDSS
jgi:sporulation protein YlmC with PRC-barrel domain